MSVRVELQREADVTSAGAAALAARIRAGEVTALEALEAHLERIRQLNPVVNAFVLVDEEGARRRAEQADAALGRGELWGPLHGVPFSVKDALETAGLATTCGTPRLRRHLPARDATVVARLKSGGAVLLGKTNVPTLTSDYQTDNALFGQTRNPWDLDRSPGGSSGGGAAAVAAGLSPLEVASDVGGSTRLPAHYCGIPGLKPTSRRIPLTGHIPPLPGQRRGLKHLASLGFLGHTVADLRLALELTLGPDGFDQTVPPVPLAPRRPREPESLRIAWTTDFPGVPLANEVRETCEDLAALLAGAGAKVDQLSPSGFDPLAVAETYGAIFGAEINATQAEDPHDAEQLRRLRALGCAEPYARGYALGFDASVHDYTKFLHRRDDWIALVESIVEGYDAWICPVAPTLALTHRKRGEPIEVSGAAWPYVAQGWYCLPFNVTDHPVVILPGRGLESRLPCGVQLVGRLWGDAALLDAAECVAALAGPIRRPTVAAEPPIKGEGTDQRLELGEPL
jgi:amidase